MREAGESSGCLIYPGNESLEGKILRLKQQYTLCSATLSSSTIPIFPRQCFILRRRSKISTTTKYFDGDQALRRRPTQHTRSLKDVITSILQRVGDDIHSNHLPQILEQHMALAATAHVNLATVLQAEAHELTGAT